MERSGLPNPEIAILLVEDESGAREMLGRSLQMNYPGLAIYLAENGAVGLELFRRHRPELVLTDINMPVQNGISMSRQIKALEPETTIVAVTAHSDTSYLLDAIEIGIDHYVLKPVNYAELFAVLERVIEKISLKRVVAQQLERIRRREQQLSEAQKLTHLGSWEWEAQSGEVAGSDELYRILGIEPERAPRRAEELLERVHPGDRETLRNALGELIGKRERLCAHYFRVLRPDGSLRIVRGQLEVNYAASGKPVSLIGTCHDVTEQKGAEAALRASEQRFFKIFQATPDLLSITGLEQGSYLEVNEAFLRALGYRRQEVVGRQAAQLPVWEREQERLALIRGLKERGRVRDREARFRTKDGGLLDGLVSAELIEMNGKQFLLTLFKDISDRKRLERERARLAAIVESSDDAIIATDREGRVATWNDGARRMLGFDAGETTGRELCRLAPVQLRDDMNRLQQGVLRDGVMTHLESLFVRKDGGEINVSLTISPIRGDGGIVGTSCIARDVTERTRMEETIKHQAQHDPLTDLPNRKLFMDFLNLELAQARRNRKNLAVLFLDLDRFKQINDTLGHKAGDLLLQAVAQRLKRCVRESDTVARIGGDEFNVLMPDLSQTDDVGTVVGKIMGVFAPPFLLDNVEVPATTSVGISMFPADGQSSEELVQKADSAMYVAKQANGNSYQFYNEEINSRTLNRQRLERLLREAVPKGELELLFQPQVQVDSRRLVGAEALLRWRHPEQGVLLPEQFLPVAEETGAILPIGDWVLRQACALLRSWRGKGYGFTVTVNLSNRQFHQPNLAELTAAALGEYGVPPQALELDVTERAIMEDADISIRNMRKLSELGVAIAVDDFGVGSSSLQWIKQLPIAKLKIDRSFIRDILTEPDDLAVVSAVICMSHNLRLRVNAVGVESEAQLDLIRSYGCDEMQGDLISRPLPAEEFEKLVTNL